MGKYHRLLVGVDGSEASLHAFRESCKLTGSWVTVVAVAPFYEGDLGLVGVANPQALLTEPCNLALEEAQELANEAGAVINKVCAVGVPHERIVELAAKGSRDLIVVGAKGQSLVERSLLGSVTRRVIGYSPVDVLVVPEKTSIGWEKLLLATDGSPGGRRAAAQALDLAQAYGSELVVVSGAHIPAHIYAQASGSVLQTHWSWVSEVLAQAEKLQIKARGFVPEDTPVRGITALAAQENVNLIVMGARGHTGLKRLLMGSVTEKVIGHAPCPVLVVRK